MATLPPGALGPVEGPSGRAGDLNLRDWQAAEQRRAATSTAASRLEAAPLDLSEGPAPALGGPAPTWAPGAGEQSAVPAWAPVAGVQAAAAPAWQARLRWVRWARAWAAVKMTISAVSFWFTMEYLHAGWGEMMAGYGVLCFWWAVGPHWRKRCFGPGQQLEPELYELVAKWLWRIGSVLVLCGAALYLA